MGRWQGRSRVRLSVEKEKAIKQLSKQGKGVSEIARVVGLSRPTIYKAIG
jgi:DNA-binding CsgD family transcriptional regulator